MVKIPDSVRGKIELLTFVLIALQVFNPASVGRIMYHASIADTFRKRNPDIGLVGRAVELNEDGYKRMSQQRELVFGFSPGKS